MKFINEEKYYSIYEISKISGVSRKEILEYEKEGLILPSFKDKETLYRYYDPLIIFKLNEVKMLKNASLTDEDIRRYYELTLNNEEKTNLLEKKIEDINNSLLLLKNIKSINKIITKDVFYYYEERNLKTIDNLVLALFKEIYIHVLNKDYLIDSSSLPFLLIKKEKLENSLSSPFKVKFCIPLTKDYKEKNIERLPSKSGVQYKSSNTNFENSLLEFNLSILKNSIDIENEFIMYIYFSSLKINNFIAFTKK